MAKNRVYYRFPENVFEIFESGLSTFEAKNVLILFEAENVFNLFESQTSTSEVISRTFEVHLKYPPF